MVQRDFAFVRVLVLPIFLGVAGQSCMAQFALVNPMAAPRAAHTATLLRDGRVLIAGGWQGKFEFWTALSSAEIYNPVTRTFTATGNMRTARAYHTAIPLPDGRVLIEGGWDLIHNSPALAPEIYDPSTGIFSGTGSMVGGLGSASNGLPPAACSLKDGKVFIAGLPLAQIFDPVTGTFTATGPYPGSAPGDIYSATTLQDGRVLITGATQAFDAGWTEIYDPVARSFSLSGLSADWDEISMAILLPSGQVLFIGNEGSPAIVQIFDPPSGKFTLIGSDSLLHYDAAATPLPDGTVLITGGGHAVNGEEWSSAVLYSPVSSTFFSAGHMTTSRADHTATLLTDGTVLIAGGQMIIEGSSDDLPATSSAEVYTPGPPPPPPAVNINVTSFPSGLTLLVDSTPITTPHVFNWTIGSCHTFNGNTQPGSPGTQYVLLGNFPSSSCFSADGGYTLIFTAQYFLTTAAGTGGTISPPSGWYNTGSLVSVSATAGAGYTFAGFSGILNGTANPQFVVMNAPLSVTANFGGTSPNGSKVGIFRNVAPSAPQFLLDANGNTQLEPGVDTFTATFAPPGGNMAGDIAVVGDWSGNGHSKVGLYRPSAGVWYLDSNGDGQWDSGDANFPIGLNFGGIVGDVPVVGDWTLQGKDCIGLFRQGFSWLLDLNCNGTFDGTPADAFFPFGGLKNDVPVVGKWVAGQPTRVGVVRAYAPGGVVGNCTAADRSGCPFYWVYDNANPNAGGSPANHQPAANAYAFGGLFGDVFVTGDWNNSGVTRGGIYRQGIWIEDVTGLHNGDTFFGFGGLSTDVPIVGKW